MSSIGIAFGGAVVLQGLILASEGVSYENRGRGLQTRRGGYELLKGRVRVTKKGVTSY